MDDTWIRSAQNSKLKHLREIRAGKDRDSVLLEGARVLSDALDASVIPEWVLFDPILLEIDSVGSSALHQAQSLGVTCLPCDPKLLAADRDLTSSSKLFASAPRPQMEPESLLKDAADASGLVVVSAGIQDPGNAGALIRVAAGLGAFGVLFLDGGVSPWHPRAIRGASGTTFRLPVAEGLSSERLVELGKSFGVELWATASEGKSMAKVHRKGPVALILGAEGTGMSDALIHSCQELVCIPLQRGVESLNVAAAAAVLVQAFA